MAAEINTILTIVHICGFILAIALISCFYRSYKIMRLSNYSNWND